MLEKLKGSKKPYKNASTCTLVMYLCYFNENTQKLTYTYKTETHYSIALNTDIKWDTSISQFHWQWQIKPSWTTQTEQARDRCMGSGTSCDIPTDSYLSSKLKTWKKNSIHFEENRKILNLSKLLQNSR